jgi:hypothetical protein
MVLRRIVLEYLGTVRILSYFGAVHNLMKMSGVVYSIIQDMIVDGSFGTIRDVLMRILCFVTCDTLSSYLSYVC